MNDRMFSRRFRWTLAALLFCGVGITPAAMAQGPSFSCTKLRAGSIEELVCKDEALSALDRQLASAYASASRKAKNEHPSRLKAEQRGWVKGRDDCWKSDDKRTCVQQVYEHRVVELQARYRLVDAMGPIRYACNGNRADEVTVTFFKTEPASLIAERGDSQSLMVREQAAGGTRYVGRNESFREQQGEATIVWGYGTPEMRCTKAG